MLGLGNSITSRYIESSNWPGATKFLNLDGSDDFGYVNSFLVVLILQMIYKII